MRGQAASNWLPAELPDAVLLDMRMPGLGGDELLRRFRRIDPRLPVIVVTALWHHFRGGQRDPGWGFRIHHQTIPQYASRENRSASGRAAISRPTRDPQWTPHATITMIMGQSPAIQTLVTQVEAVVSTDYSVVITGETGAGKEVVACKLHNMARGQAVRSSSSIAAPSPRPSPTTSSSGTKRVRTPEPANATVVASRPLPRVGRSF